VWCPISILCIFFTYVPISVNIEKVFRFAMLIILALARCHVTDVLVGFLDGVWVRLWLPIRGRFS
jgi:hypothetical protein